MPSRWKPLETVDPRTGEMFTEAGAWEFIAEHLDGGTELERITLKQPEGRTGYVMIVQGAVGHRRIYIKLQLGSGTVFGRSFHDERPEGDKDE